MVWLLTGSDLNKMHIDCSQFPNEYKAYTGKKIVWLSSLLLVLFLVFIISISFGAVQIPLADVIKTLIGNGTVRKWNLIIWNIRLPQAITAIIAGIGLSVCGVSMQSILKNPLGSPFTLGISHAAAFGAAFSVVIFGTGSIHSSISDSVKIIHPYITTFSAFVFCLIATAIIIFVSKIKKTSPEVIILTGVALASLFTAGTMFMQYFADDTQLAAIVFWSFGDVARASWKELGYISILVLSAFIFFMFNRWNYNAMEAGDETAKGLGVQVEQVRILGLLVSSVVTAVIISFLGIIGFVGLVCPHISRRLIGNDHRFLIPFASLIGAILLLMADTVARLIIAPHILPVAVLTSFLGAPVFIYLIVKGHKR